MSLHAAAAWLTTLDAPWSAADLATLGDADPGRAKAYATGLARAGVLIAEGGLYRAGPKAAAWRQTQPKTRPGGNAKDYRAKQAVRDRLRLLAWREARTRGVLTSQQPQDAKDQAQAPHGSAGVPNQEDEDVVDTLLSPQAVAAKLDVSRDTVERMIRAGRLAAVRVGAAQLRIEPTALEQYIRENRYQPKARA